MYHCKIVKQMLHLDTEYTYNVQASANNVQSCNMYVYISTVSSCKSSLLPFRLLVLQTVSPHPPPAFGGAVSHDSSLLQPSGMKPDIAQVSSTLATLINQFTGSYSSGKTYTF